MRITVVGHSTVLIETADLRVLTDPFFGTWGNPAYARVCPPGKTREELLDVDLVLLSHNHWDHTDRRFFRSLADDVPVLAPARSHWITRIKGAKNVLGAKPWSTHRFGSSEVTVVPAIHMATTVGFVISAGGQQAYFAGDTYHGGFMKRIGQRFALDVALMPVTTYRIPMTMGETSAVKAVRDLRPRRVIPIHLGLAPRSPLLRTRQSAGGFAARVKDAGLDTEVLIPHNGAPCVLE